MSNLEDKAKECLKNNCSKKITLNDKEICGLSIIKYKKELTDDEYIDLIKEKIEKINCKYLDYRAYSFDKKFIGIHCIYQKN